MRQNPFSVLEGLYQDPETRLIYTEMAAWMQRSLTWVDDALASYPPQWPEPPMRRAALFVLDEPLHVLAAPIVPAVNAFLNARIGRVVEQIETEVVTRGVTIWKLYNHGFVVKTPEVTLGFDLHQGPYASFSIAPALFDRILQATDALYISHAHSDHADAYAIPQMVKLGRPVVAPPQLWQDQAIYPRLTQPERDRQIRHELVLRGAPITYRVFPGHQGSELLNNVYLVTLPGGITVMHTGDQSNYDDLDVWIDHVHEDTRVDLLFPNCWSTDLPRLIQGTRPRLVVPGHENEMSHSVDHREAFSKTYAQVAGVSTPVLVMAWGERYHYETDLPLTPAPAPDDAQGSVPGSGPEAAMQAMQQYLHRFV